MIYFPRLEMVMHLKMQLNTRLLLHNMERERELLSSMLWTSFRKVINIENALQYFTFRNLGYHFTSKKMHSINFRKCPLFLLTNYEVAWGLDVSSDCNVFLKSFSIINDAFKYLVEGNLSKLFLLATNLSPPTSRMTHLPSHLQMKVTDLIRRMCVNIVFLCVPRPHLSSEWEVWGSLQKDLTPSFILNTLSLSFLLKQLKFAT